MVDKGKKACTIKSMKKALHDAYREILEIEKGMTGVRKEHCSRIRYMLLWLMTIPCDGRIKNLVLPDYRTIGMMKRGQVEIMEVGQMKKYIKEELHTYIW